MAVPIPRRSKVHCMGNPDLRSEEGEDWKKIGGNFSCILSSDVSQITKMVSLRI